jgi:hypothetical protein
MADYPKFDVSLVAMIMELEARHTGGKLNDLRYLPPQI